MTVPAPALCPVGEGRPLAPATSPALAERQVDAGRAVPDIVDVWGRDSFPASDAPANW